MTHHITMPDLPEPLTKWQLALAVKTVERYAPDARDRAELLTMLGLSDD